MRENEKEYKRYVIQYQQLQKEKWFDAEYHEFHSQFDAFNICARLKKDGVRYRVCTRIYSVYDVVQDK